MPWEQKSITGWLWRTVGRQIAITMEERVRLLLLKLYGHDVVETHYKKYT